MSMILEAQNLSKFFPIHGGLFRKQVGQIHAVDSVSLQLKKGQTLGIVGESGCGKSTLGRTLVRLYEPTSGQILFKGQDFIKFNGPALKQARKKIQMIFQDPYASLNARMSVKRILEEPFQLHNMGTPKERTAWVTDLLSKVGLGPEALHRFPHEFSGGQRQRIGIARAIALKPELVVCDEPVSALDVSIQSQILNLLAKLQQELELTYIFISHDLSVVRHISDRVAVMYLGKIVEEADCETLFKNPEHPYTQALLASLPVPDPRKRALTETLTGEVPNAATPPPGCHFHARCKFAEDRCRTDAPVLEIRSNDTSHKTACHLVGRSG